MLQSAIAEKLTTLGRAVMAKYPTINAGGCCVYAALIAAKLAKVVPVQVRVEGFSHAHQTNIDHIRPQMANDGCDWGTYNVMFNHVIVTYEDNGLTWYYDSRGATTSYEPLVASRIVNSERCLYSGSLTITEASYLASESRRWNPSFDRADIQDLIELVDDFFTREFSVH